MIIIVGNGLSAMRMLITLYVSIKTELAGGDYLLKVGNNLVASKNKVKYTSFINYKWLVMSLLTNESKTIIAQLARPSC